MHLHVMEQNVHIDEYLVVLYSICVYRYLLAVYWYVLACILCTRGICIYWSVLVSILWIDLLYSVFQIQKVCTIGTYWQYLYVTLICILVYLYVLLVSVDLFSMHIAKFAHIDLNLFACIGLHCVHWPVLHVVVCIDICASIDCYHLHTNTCTIHTF